MGSISSKNNIECRVAVIGCGRFGDLWATLCADIGLEVLVYDSQLEKNVQSVQDSQSPQKSSMHSFLDASAKSKYTLISVEKISTADIVFFCVPISKLALCIKDLQAHIAPHAIVCDTCSVKVSPIQWMREILPPTQEIIGLHPLFGPDSYLNKKSRNIVVSKVRISDTNYEILKTVFHALELNITEMSAEEHDRQSLYTQGLTHLLGRALYKLNLENSLVTTQGYDSLLKIIDQTCKDSPYLFYDILQYNNNSSEMSNSLLDSISDVIDELENHKNNVKNHQE